MSAIPPSPPKIIGSGKLLSSTGDHSVDYTVQNGWSAKCALDCDTQWMRYNLEVLDAVQRTPMSEEELDKVLSSLQLEDLRWRWSDKCSALKGDEYEWFFLYAFDKPQGACVVYHPKDSELQGGKIFYVEYLAVAPWNRKSLMRTREYKSVGSILLRTVLKFCVDNLGLSPGFSLHSLPQASGYYKKLNMVNICSLDKDLLVYFELPPVEARKLLSVA